MLQGIRLLSPASKSAFPCLSLSRIFSRGRPCFHLLSSPERPQLHLEICLKDLQEDYMNGAHVKISQPVVSYRETVSAESSQQCLSKSPNKHNRLYLTACPLEAGIPEDVEEGRLNPREDVKVLFPAAFFIVFCLRSANTTIAR